MFAPSAADVDAKFALQRRKAALQCADDAGGNARGMPIHSHHRAKRLKPEWMRQPLQEFIASVVMDDGSANNGTERGHAACQATRHTPAGKRNIGAAWTSGPGSSICFAP